MPNLRKYFERFDPLDLLDNGEDDDRFFMPQPVVRAIKLGDGRIFDRMDRENLAPWCDRLITRIEQVRETRKAQVQQLEKKRTRHLDR